MPADEADALSEGLMDDYKIIFDEKLAGILGLKRSPSRLSDFVFEEDVSSVKIRVEAGDQSFNARVVDGEGRVTQGRFTVIRTAAFRVIVLEALVAEVPNLVLATTQELLVDLASLSAATAVLAGRHQPNEVTTWAFVMDGKLASNPPKDSYSQVLVELLSQKQLVVAAQALKAFPAAALLQEYSIESLHGSTVSDETGTTFLLCLFGSPPPQPEYISALMAFGMKAIAADDARQAAAAELSTANERFRVAVSAANIGIWNYDFSTETVTVQGDPRAAYRQNPSALKSWGMPIHRADASRVVATFAEAVAKREDFRCSFRVLDGENTRYFESFGRPIFEDERPVRMIGAHVDITRQREAELKAVEQSRRLELVISSAGMGFWEWDPTTDLIVGTEPSDGFAMNVARTTREQYLQRLLSDDRAKVADWMETCLRGGGANGISHRVEVDGHLRWVEIRGDRIVEEEQGEPDKVRVMGLIWDVTDRRERAERLADAEAELRRMNQRYALATEAAGAGLWEADLASDQVTWDSKTAAIFGISEAAELQFGTSWRRHIHPEDIERVSAEMNVAVSEKTASSVFRIQLPNHETRHLRSYAHFIKDGETGKLIGLTQDVTAERVAELREHYRNKVLEKLISSSAVEQVLEVLVGAIEAELPGIRVGFMLVDPQGGRLKNASAPSMPAFFLDAAQNLPIGEGYGSCGAAAFLQESVLVHDVDIHPNWVEFRELAKAADIKACWSIPIVGGGGQIFGTLGIYFREVQTFNAALLRRLSEAADFASLAISRKQDEVGLQNREMLLRATGEIAKVGGWELDLRNDTRQWTEQMYRLHGVDPGTRLSLEDMIGVYSPESQVSMRTLMAQTLSDGSAHEVLLNRVTEDGVRWLRVAGRAVFENGKPIKLRGATQDVTEQVAAAAERERLHEQLLQAQKMESVGRLAGGVAHDFNNFLSVILGHAELALEELPAESALARDLDEIRRAAERSASLTRQLLAFARKQPIAPTRTNFNSTIAEMVNMLTRLIGERISLTWESDTELWNVFVDPSQIDQILVNLCVNARDAIEGDGRISIQTRNRVLRIEDVEILGDCPPGDYVMLEVSDTGGGIAASLIENVFEPFFTTKPVGEGTGLGLATVYGVVMQNDGCIHVTSNVGQGTAFALYFPKNDGRASEIDAVASVALEVQGCRILLVEDEPALLKLAKRMIERMGHEVIAAANPAEAIRLASEVGTIDVLVSDVIMPGMNGRQLANQLALIRPEMKRIFISGYTAEVMKLEGNLNVDEYFLQKPFGMNELKLTIEKCLDKHQ